VATPLIGPQAGSTPTDLRVTRGRVRELPDDVLRDASRRLGIMSLIVGVLWLLGTVFGHLAARAMMPPGDPRWMRLDMTDAIAVISIVASLGLFAYTRRSRRSPKSILDLGLIYLVFTGLGLGVMIHWQGAPPDWSMEPVISWIGAAVLMFAAIVPNAPRKVFVASLIAVSMNPVGMLIVHARGVWSGSAWDALLMHYPDYLLVGVAVVISHVVTKLGQQVARAREMGSYRLGELLGRGGMGEVYKATHRMLARPAAIKLIRPEMLAGRNDAAAVLAVARFRREAEAAAALRSPHTVELYDFGVTEDDTIYFVMELLDGMNLETLVRQHGPLPANRVIHILCQVCESLEEAHVRGLVHRDIKPPNIHLGLVGLRHDFVKVLDFGLVKTVASGSDGHSLATAQGMTPGTPSYMAPEMALGENVDGRADIYALGCVAYFLLTGQLVFEADNMLAMIAKHLQTVPVPPSQRTATHIPAALERVIMTCLEKDPAERPQSAAALAQVLASIDEEPWGEEQAKRWWTANAQRPAPAMLQDSVSLSGHLLPIG
jgi:serine/threonine protein kinase